MDDFDWGERIPEDNIFRNEDGKIAGILRGNIYYSHRWAFKNEDHKAHFFRKCQGYPIDVKFANRLKELGCIYVIIIEHRVEGVVKKWFVELQQYINATAYKEEPFDWQYGLPLKSMYEML